MTEPFLAFVSRLQRDNQAVQKSAQREPQQLNLFHEDESEIQSEMLASLIALDFVNAVVGAGGNLSTVGIQLAVNRVRERTAALLNREFSHRHKEIPE
jgi:hypothetical protein